MKLRWLVAICSLLIFSVPVAFAAASNDSVAFNVQSDDGEPLMITISANQATDVYAYELNFTYDEQRLKLKKTTAPHNGFMVPPLAESGQLRIAYTLIGPKPGLKGNLELVTLLFERIAPGKASVVLEEVKLVDADIQAQTYSPKLAIDFAASWTKPTDIGGHWAENAIGEALQRGIVYGYGDGTFRPDRPVTRAEFAAMLVRALELPLQSGAQFAFTDAGRIPVWALPSIAAARQAGLIEGYDDGSFRAERHIDRTEMTVMLVRALGDRYSSAVEELAYADKQQIPAWAQLSIAAATEAGIMKGKPGNRFAPDDNATRAEAVTAILGLLAIAKE
jgi:hypothetical protein